jgi:hypothetical protein
MKKYIELLTAADGWQEMNFALSHSFHAWQACALLTSILRMRAWA